VFGFRASKMRQGKISALIHNSAQYPNLAYCEVEEGRHGREIGLLFVHVVFAGVILERSTRNNQLGIWDHLLATFRQTVLDFAG
jgi:chromosome segregation ATPase